MRHCRPLLGTFVEVECDSAEAIDAAFTAIEHVHRLMSAHDPDSELSKLNHSAHRTPMTVSEPTAAVLLRAAYWASLTDGAFDVVSAGRGAVARGVLPIHPGQPRPDPLADWTVLRLDGLTVTLDRPACLDVGGIAKGYAVDLAVAAMRRTGAARGLVNAGGDLRGFGEEPWPVAVVDPLTRRPQVMIALDNEALATSAGVADNGAELDFSHLPRSSRGWLSVSVRATNACDADALTKVVWAMADGAAPLLLDHGAVALAIDAHRRVIALGRTLAAA